MSTLTLKRIRVLGIVAPLYLRTLGFVTFISVVWKHKPIYMMSSLSLVTWAIVMWYQNEPSVLAIYPMFALLPFPLSTVLYAFGAVSWPLLFYFGQFRAARIAILAQGLIHLSNGINFIPSVIFDFPGSMTRAVIYSLLGIILIKSWHETPAIVTITEDHDTL